MSGASAAVWTAEDAALGLVVPTGDMVGMVVVWRTMALAMVDEEFGLVVVVSRVLGAESEATGLGLVVEGAVAVKYGWASTLAVSCGLAEPRAQTVPAPASNKAVVKAPNFFVSLVPGSRGSGTFSAFVSSTPDVR